MEIFLGKNDDHLIAARNQLGLIIEVIRDFTFTNLNESINKLKTFIVSALNVFTKLICTSALEATIQYLENGNLSKFEFRLSLIKMALDDDIKVLDIHRDKGTNLKNSIFFI